MFFFLSTPEYNNFQSNITKIRVHLMSGVAEILEQHQDLMGKIDNNIIEIETAFDNKIEKTLFVLQEAVFIVSTKGLDSKSEDKGTGVYVYAKKGKLINNSLSIDETIKQYELKKLQLDNEIQKSLDPLIFPAELKMTKTKILLLNEETDFLKKVIGIAKELKV
jgi:hypothetical protein